MLDDLADLKRAFIALLATGALLSISPTLNAQPAKGPATKGPDVKAGTDSALKKMRRKEDKVEGITFYYDQSTPHLETVNNVHLYIGQKGSDVWLCWMLQYVSNSWLFAKAYIVAADDKRFEQEARFERDHSGGTIWELHNTLAGKRELEIVQAILDAKDVTIRYIGDKYHKDRKVSAQEKQALRNVLNAYAALGGKP